MKWFIEELPLGDARTLKGIRGSRCSRHQDYWSEIPFVSKSKNKVKSGESLQVEIGNQQIKIVLGQNLASLMYIAGQRHADSGGAQTLAAEGKDSGIVVHDEELVMMI